MSSVYFSFFKKIKIKKVLGQALIFAFIFALGILFEYFYLAKRGDLIVKKSPSINFISESYDIIKNNYWDKVSDEKLSGLFELGAEKLTGSNQPFIKKNKKSLLKIIGAILAKKNKPEREKFVTQLTDLVLKSLPPIGRSSLYTEKSRKNLQKMVNNINKEGKKEPTVIAKPIAVASPANPLKPITPEILYLQIKRFSPSTFNELEQASAEADKIKTLDTLILDLRGNIGGSIDILPYFLGPFIGKDQYAYEFYHQGEKMPFKTKTGWLNSLVRYKKVVVLIDGNTQSTAEVFASVLKKYNVGILIGERTRGWGTVERTFNLKEHLSNKTNYSIFLVHSLTLRDDGQFIEGNGVEPVIYINDPHWKKQLFAYFHWEALADEIENVWNNPPFK